MNGPRRRLLAAAGGVAASLAGCVTSLTESRDHAPESPGREPGDPTTTATRQFPATVEANVTVDREGIAYVEHNDTVRYVAGYESQYPDGKESPPEREPVYEHLPFEEWAEAECAGVGAERVNEAMDERLDGDVKGVVSGVTRTEDGRAVFVAHQTRLDRDGDVIARPTVSYERVKRAAPERVAVTLSLAGRTHSCAPEVTTQDREIHRQ